jgi:Domain of unknown function (DUF4871)
VKKKVWIFIILCIALTGCNPISELMRDDQMTFTPNFVPAFFQEADVENIVWKESSTFHYDGNDLRGTKGKGGVVATEWEAEVITEYTWHFFGERIPTGPFSVVAVKKGTTEPIQAIVLENGTKQAWSTEPIIMDNVDQAEHGQQTVSMMLPSEGMWVLNAYIGEILSEQIVINVK